MKGKPTEDQTVTLEESGAIATSGRLVQIECPRCEHVAPMSDLVRYGCVCGADVDLEATFSVTGESDDGYVWYCEDCEKAHADDYVICEDPDQCVRSEQWEGCACGHVVCPDCRGVLRELPPSVAERVVEGYERGKA